MILPDMATLYALVLQRHRWSARPEHVAHSRAHSAHNAAGGLCTFERLSRGRESGVLGRSGSGGRLRRALAEATVNHTELPQFITRALPLQLLPLAHALRHSRSEHEKAVSHVFCADGAQPSESNRLTAELNGPSPAMGREGR